MMKLVNVFIGIYWVSIAAVMVIGEMRNRRKMITEQDRAYVQGYCDAVRRLAEQPELRAEIFAAAATEGGWWDGEDAQSSVDNDRRRSVESEGVRTASGRDAAADGGCCGARA